MAQFNARVPAAKEVVVLNLPLQVMKISPKFIQRTGLLFVGRLMEQDSPNWQGLMWFLQFAWPLVRQKNSSMTLSIVGRYAGNETPIQAEGVRWHGGVENLQPHYDQARLFIAPVFIATGIPLKVLNAVAAGLPVVGTSRMADLLQWPPSALPTANTAIDFAQLILDLYEDELRWVQVQKSSQELIRDNYSIDGFEKNLLKILG
jgi:glycosyltransferase involved in cell wall biosynthesis